MAASLGQIGQLAFHGGRRALAHTQEAPKGWRGSPGKEF